MNIRDATDETLDRIVRKAHQNQLDQFARNLAAIVKDVRDHQVPEGYHPELDIRKGRAAMAKQFAEIRARAGV